MANRQRYNLSDPTPGQTHVSPATVSERTVTLPVDGRLCLSWIGKDRGRKKVLWRLMDDGSALGLSAADHLDTLLERAADDPEFDGAFRQAFSLGQFHPEDRLVLPEPVIAHLLGRQAQQSDELLWIRVADDRIHLMRDAAFKTSLSRANDIIDEVLNT